MEASMDGWTDGKIWKDGAGAEDAVSSASDQTICPEAPEVTSAAQGSTTAAPPVQQGTCAMALSRLQGNQYGQLYRDYSIGPSEWGVEDNYRLNHMFQTHAFAKEQAAKWGTLPAMELGVWEAAELLNEVVDDSDPDIGLPQLEHLLQTAEAIRAAYPQEDWFHLVGFIHDLGKVLAHPALGSQPQWAVVGDTFPTGCAHDGRIVFPDLFAGNPDAQDPRYRSELGVYDRHCGLANVAMSWGHDEYLWLVLQGNGCTLPEQAMFIIRYHSFYALHSHGAYEWLLSNSDRRLLPWLKTFQRFDLHSKSDRPVNVAELKPYYMGLIDKYFPNNTLKW